MPDFKVAPTVNGIGLVRVNGADPLTANWDIGASRRILAEGVRARSTAGIKVEDSSGNLGVQVENGGLVVVGANGMQFRGSSIAHGMTDFVSTDTYGQIVPGTGTFGGLSIQAFTDTDGISPLSFAAYFGADPTDTLPAIQFLAQKKSGTNAVALGAAETVMAVDNSATRLATLLGSGFMALGTETPLAPLHVGGDNSGIQVVVAPTGTNVRAMLRMYPQGAPTSANGRSIVQFFNTDFGADAANYEYGQFGFLSDYVDLFSGKAGTGTLRPIRLRVSGFDNQLILNTAGQVGVNAAIANIDSLIYVEGNTTNLLHVHNTGSGATANDFSSIYFSNPNQKWSFNLGAHGNATWLDKFYIYDNTRAAPVAIWDLLGKMGVGGLTAPAAQLHVDQASTTAAVPVLLLDQADLSEEFIEFTATVGAGNPIDTAALGSYYGKIRVNVTGVGYKYIGLYNT